jgi:WD40 repeat protein
MEFNHSDEILVSSDAKHLIKIWNLENGKLLRKLQMEHGIGSICWGIDPSHLAVGYQDIKLYGIRSCMVLKEYSVSSGGDFINKILISEGRIYAIANSGLVKIFNYSTQEELISTHLRQTVLQVQPIYAGRSGNVIERVLVITAKRVYELNRSGEEEQRYKLESGELVGGSCVGEFLY